MSVSAPWPTSPLSPLAEASEFVAEGGSNLFWDFVEALGDAPHAVFCPPSACSGHGHRAGDGAATAEEGGGRHDDPQEPTARVTGAAQPQQQGSVPPEEAAVAAAGLAADAAVTAAGHGFGSGAAGAAGAGTPGTGLDRLSLRLLEVALSARCASCLSARRGHV